MMHWILSFMEWTYRIKKKYRHKIWKKKQYCSHSYCPQWSKHRRKQKMKRKKELSKETSCMKLLGL